MLVSARRRESSPRLHVWEKLRVPAGGRTRMATDAAAFRTLLRFRLFVGRYLAGDSFDRRRHLAERIRPLL